MLIYGETYNAGDRTTLTTPSTEVRTPSHDNLLGFMLYPII